MWISRPVCSPFGAASFASLASCPCMPRPVAHSPITRSVEMHCSTSAMRDSVREFDRGLLTSCSPVAAASSGNRRFISHSSPSHARSACAVHPTAGPRLHDLRHRFATETLLRWSRSGKQIERKMPTLATYLGHSNIADTYWYLSAHPQLMRHAALRLERRWGGA